MQLARCKRWAFLWYIYIMPKVKKTIQNPHGLSSKQKLVIDDMVADIEQGKPIDAVKSTGLFYGSTDIKTIRPIASKNTSRDNFREALIEKLSKSKIIGKNSRIANKLSEGLEAVSIGKFGHAVDYKTRLAYIQEINKITGVYAPEKIDKRTLKINVDMTSEELQNKINELQKELQS